MAACAPLLCFWVPPARPYFHVYGKVIVPFLSKLNKRIPSQHVAVVEAVGYSGIAAVYVASLAAMISGRAPTPLAAALFGSTDTLQKEEKGRVRLQTGLRPTEATASIHRMVEPNETEVNFEIRLHFAVLIVSFRCAQQCAPLLYF